MCIVSDELYEEAEDLRALLKIIDRRLESELQLGHELDRDGSLRLSTSSTLRAKIVKVPRGDQVAVESELAHPSEEGEDVGERGSVVSRPRSTSLEVRCDLSSRLVADVVVRRSIFGVELDLCDEELDLGERDEGSSILVLHFLRAAETRRRYDRLEKVDGVRIVLTEWASENRLEPCCVVERVKDAEEGEDGGEVLDGVDDGGSSHDLDVVPSVGIEETFLWDSPND
jgi:hypothetical protein